MNYQKNNITFNRGYNINVSVTLFSVTSIMIITFILYIYDFVYNYNTLLFILLVPLMILFFFFNNDLFHPFNIFFITTQFLFVFNMIDVNANKNYFRYGTLDSTYYDQAFFWAILVIIIWYLFMYLGYAYSRSTKTTKVVVMPIFKIDNQKKIAIILIFVGIISYGIVVFLKGGFTGIIESLTQRVEAYAGLTYFNKLTGLVAVGSIMLLASGYRKISMVLILFSFLLLASFGGRASAFLGSIFPYIVFYHYRIKKLSLIKLIPLAILLFLFAIGLGNYRLYQEIRININGLYDLLSKVAYGTQGGEILPSLVGSLLKGNIEYQYGSTLVNIVFAPIPSSLWPNKPHIDESGIVGKALMGSEYWGLPPGPYGISFFNFGFLGVIIIAFIVGIIVRKLYYKFVIKRSVSDIGLIFYILIIPNVFNFISTSSQINILWFSGIFILIKLLDNLISLLKQNNYLIAISSNKVSKLTSK